MHQSSETSRAWRCFLSSTVHSHLQDKFPNMLNTCLLVVTFLADEVISLFDRLPYRQATHDLMAILFILWRQQVPPNPQVHLNPPLDVLDKVMNPHGRPEDQN